MKLKSLYVKLLLSFIGVLVITEILILILFVVTAGRTFKNQIDKQSVAKLAVFKTSLQDKIDKIPTQSITENEELKTYLRTFSQLFDLDIWVTDAGEKKVWGRIPEGFSGIPQKRGPPHGIIKEDGIVLYHLSRRHMSYYARVDVRQNSTPYTVHLFLVNENDRKPEAVFFLGLLVIGGVIAALIVPLARVITKRLKRLNDAAFQFADGHLEHRCDIKGSDEIAKLGEAFNFMADRLEKMIRDNKELMANISHELRSPLARIRMSKELIWDRAKDMGDEGVIKHAALIEQEVDELDDLIDQILKLSKMEFQQVSQSLEVIRLDRMFAQTSRKFEAALGLNSLELEANFEGDLEIKADSQVMDMVFSNLLDNAVKYAPQNSVIRVKGYGVSQNSVVFSIANEANKQMPEQLESLFKPFYRAHDADHIKGTGLGLTIVSRLLEKMDARITAASNGGWLKFELSFKPA